PMTTSAIIRTGPPMYKISSRLPGGDARDEMFVQQTDIDGLAQPLVPQLTASAQTALAPLIAQQLQPGEQTVLPTPMCSPNVQANHKVIEAATTVTVSVTVTCYQIAYAPQDFLPGVIHAQQEQVNQLYGYAYHLVGDMLAEPPVYSSTDASRQTANVSVKANS